MAFGKNRLSGNQQKSQAFVEIRAIPRITNILHGLCWVVVFGLCLDRSARKQFQAQRSAPGADVCASNIIMRKISCHSQAY
jgi:hypothetical protein